MEADGGPTQPNIWKRVICDIGAPAPHISSSKDELPSYEVPWAETLNPRSEKKTKTAPLGLRYTMRKLTWLSQGTVRTPQVEHPRATGRYSKSPKRWCQTLITTLGLVAYIFLALREHPTSIVKASHNYTESTSEMPATQSCTGVKCVP